MAKLFDPQKQLEKHGWKEGSGLGREEHGIKEAIKVKIKQDMAGVGHDAGEEFSYHWWDHVFNKAAKSIQVENSVNGVTVQKTESADCHISRKKSHVKKLDKKPMLYGMFVKSATLTNEGQEIKEPKVDSDSSDSEIEDAGTASKCTDEELFRLCGGLTGHKAARHGHGLGGKLQRIADQEQKEILQMKPISTPVLNGQSSNDVQNPEDTDTTENFSAKRKKTRKRKKEKSETKDLDNHSSYHVDGLSESLSVSAEEKCSEVDSPAKKKKKKKKKNKDRDSQDVNNTSAVTEESTSAEPSRKKIKTLNEPEAEELSSASSPSKDSGVPKKRKKKKKKAKKECMI